MGLSWLPDRYRFAWPYHLTVAAVVLLFLFTYWFGVIVPAYATHRLDIWVTLAQVVFIFYLHFLVVWPWMVNGGRIRPWRMAGIVAVGIPSIIAASVAIAMVFGDLEADFEGATLADLLTLFDGSVPNFHAYMLPQFASLALSYGAFYLEWTHGPFANRRQWLQELRDARVAWRHAQLDPHLLDQLLTALSVITRRSKAKAQLALDLIIGLVHFHVGGNVPGKRIPLAQEVASLGSLVEIQRLRYGEALNWQLRVGEGLEAVEIMPMIPMVYAENQLHCAILDSAAHPAVLEIAREGDDLVISGFNRVKNVRKRRGSGTGLGNLEERLAYDYPSQYHMVSHIEDKCYRFRLVIHGILS